MVGALQIAIVLASVAVVTRIVALAFGAGVIGAIAAGFWTVRRFLTVIASAAQQSPSRGELRFAALRNDRELG